MGVTIQRVGPDQRPLPIQDPGVPPSRCDADVGRGVELPNHVPSLSGWSVYL